MAVRIKTITSDAEHEPLVEQAPAIERLVAFLGRPVSTEG